MITKQGYNFYEKCSRMASQEQIEFLRSNAPHVADMTVFVGNRLDFEALVESHKGQAFSLDTETTSDNTKVFSLRVKELQKRYDELEEKAKKAKEKASSYTLKNLKLEGVDIDREVFHINKQAYRDASKSFSEEYKLVKAQLQNAKKALKDCKDPLDPYKGYIGIVQIGFGNQLYYMQREFFRKNLDLMKVLLDNAPDRGVFIHNAKFDIKMMMGTFGYKIPKSKFFCTLIVEGMILSGALGGSDEAVFKRRRSLSLKSCISRRFGLNLDKGFQAGVDWDKELDAGELDYAMTDVLTGYALGMLQKELVEELGLDFAVDLEMNALYTICDMEMSGITIDYDSIFQWSVLLKGYQEEVSETLDLMLPEGLEVNYDSPAQVKKFLTEYEYIQIESTEVDELKKFEDNPFVATLLEYRKVSKLISTYVEPYLSLARQREDGSWAIYGTYSQALTNTGRFSSSEPNLQNIPADGGFEFELEELKRKFFIRDHIVARDGYYLVGGDLSQVEIRIMADIAMDEPLIEACNNNVDTHAMIASDILSVPIENVTKQMRHIGKTINLAIPYGKKPFSIAEDLGMPMPKAAIFYNNYFHKHPFIRGFMNSRISFVDKNKYVLLPSGRFRHIHDIDSDIGYIRGSAENKSYNTVIQGTAADGMKLTLHYLDEEIRNRGWEDLVIPVLTVHDELVVECHESIDKDEAQEMVTKVLKNGTQYFCNEVNIEVGNKDCNWSAFVLDKWSDLK